MQTLTHMQKEVSQSLPRKSSLGKQVADCAQGPLSQDGFIFKWLNESAEVRLEDIWKDCLSNKTDVSSEVKDFLPISKEVRTWLDAMSVNLCTVTLRDYSFGKAGSLPVGNSTPNTTFASQHSGVRNFVSILQLFLENGKWCQDRLESRPLCV